MRASEPTPSGAVWPIERAGFVKAQFQSEMKAARTFRGSARRGDVHSIHRITKVLSEPSAVTPVVLLRDGPGVPVYRGTKFDDNRCDRKSGFAWGFLPVQKRLSVPV